jgi:hypothetical protein
MCRDTFTSHENFDGQRTALDNTDLPLKHLKLYLFTVAPEAEIQLMLTDSKISNGQVGQPSWKCRIHVELVARSIWQESQKRLRQHESRAGGPCLRHVRADVLYGESR